MLIILWILLVLRFSFSMSLRLSRANHLSDTEVSKFMRTMDVIPDIIDIGPQEFLNVRKIIIYSLKMVLYRLLSPQGHVQRLYRGGGWKATAAHGGTR